MAAKGIIGEEEKRMASLCVETALGKGASAVRITLEKTVQNSISVLDGRVDRISCSRDRSLYASLFVDGSFGHFSTNRLESESLESFISEAIDHVKLLAKDPCRTLPEKESKAYGCSEGDELGLYDGSFDALSQSARLDMALKAARNTGTVPQGCTLETVEAEYSDSCEDEYMTDSDGFEGRHIETSFGFCAEATVKDSQGNRYSGYWWDSSPSFPALDISGVTAEAIQRAAGKISPSPISSGRYSIVVDRSCASRLVSPLIQALNAENIQQNNSFLKDRLGLKVFSEHLTVKDIAVEKYRAGSRLYDSEGTATANRTVIDRGVVNMFFANTHMAAKTGMKHTVDNMSRACVEPFIWNCRKKEINLKDIMSSLRDGVYVTGFNGGNCNEGTGDFSFGIEGVLFKDGHPVHPVSEVIMTGNMLGLWNSVVAAGSDPRKCSRWQIPSLAFCDVELDA
ncbi:MAG: TldD/PmbA family protein [Bacteroidales bacterium]|nr:TldD/PmbA family protein [Candidatus Hennigimonas equi]